MSLTPPPLLVVVVGERERIAAVRAGMDGMGCDGIGLDFNQQHQQNEPPSGQRGGERLWSVELTATGGWGAGCFKEGKSFMEE